MSGVASIPVPRARACRCTELFRNLRLCNSELAPPCLGTDYRTPIIVIYVRTMARRRITASQLRADVYRLLDEVIETGIPVEIERKGRVLKIAEERAPSKLSRLIRRSYLTGDAEDVVHMDWSSFWNP